MENKKTEKNKSQVLSEKNWVYKSNEMNEMRNFKMTPSQLRFFAIYLSKINSKDENTRLVTFRLTEYTRIMDFKQTNITRIQKTAEELLSVTATFKNFNESGRFIGMDVLQVFKRFRLYLGKDENWYVSIDCQDEIIPKMFGYKKYFFKYRLWNGLRLSTVNQFRMYEILKQYGTAGEREISINDLKGLLGIGEDEYPRWERFKVRVLDSCQKALAENTDIKFTYEPIKKGKKITALKFTIKPNENFIDQLTLDEFIEMQDEPEQDGELIVIDVESDISCINSNLLIYSDMCDGEFSKQELRILSDLLNNIIPERDDIKRADFLRHAYNKLNLRETKSSIKNRFGYLRGILENNLKEKSNENN